MFSHLLIPTDGARSPMPPVKRGVELAIHMGSETHKVLVHSKIPVLVYR